MKFILVYANGHQRRSFISLAAELLCKGHNVSVTYQPLTKNSPNNSPPIFAGEFSMADVVVQINEARNAAIPTDAVHITWIQDYKLGCLMPPYAEAALPRDIIYTLGHGPIIGVPCETWPNYRGSLLTAVDLPLLGTPSHPQLLDLSMVGYMPEPLLIWRAPTPHDGTYMLNPVIQSCITQTIKAHFRPLSGSLDQQAIVTKLQQALEQQFPDIWDELDKNFAGIVVHELARSHDRATIARLMLQVSDKVKFYGFNWHLWPEFKVWQQPYVASHLEQLNIYLSSGINVHNNIFGLALHTRVLEAMAVSGFVMAHATPHGNAAGQMQECFEPGVHYGEYTADNFIEQAKEWLANPVARTKAATEARKIILAKHLWRHRAEQILNDIRRL